jgi:transposase
MSEGIESGHEAGAVRLRVPDRSQVTMRLECDDELVPPGHRVRAVWDVVCRLDRSGALDAFKGPIRAREGHAGRDATDPRLLVGLWLYGCVRGVGSARELARLCVESAPYRWLCGGVTVNHRMLSEFRVGFGDALDELFTAVVASLVDKGLVQVRRVAQDGTRVRASAGHKSFRRGRTLEALLEGAREQVASLRALLEDPARSAALSSREKSARRRAADGRAARVKAALAQLPALQARQAARAKKLGNGEQGRKQRAKEPRSSTTDPDARVMKMPGGGFRPAYNVQLAGDPIGRAVVGVSVTNEGSDAGQAGPMRAQVERRTGRGMKVGEHLLDGGYLVLEEVERAPDEGVTLYVPPKPPRNRLKRGTEYDPRPTDSEALRAWRERMKGPQGKAARGQRASTSETINADLKTYRGLNRLTVRGLAKVTCVALWCALAYNVMHFAAALSG